jgi:hypothetical protein
MVFTIGFAIGALFVIVILVVIAYMADYIEKE